MILNPPVKKSSSAKEKLKDNLMLSLDFIQGKNFFLVMILV